MINCKYWIPIIIKHLVDFKYNNIYIAIYF